MATRNEMLTAFGDIKNLFGEVLGKMEIQDSGEARLAGLLLATIAESYCVIGVLGGTPYGSHSPTHCRSMMECFVNLMLLVKNPTHAEQIRFENARQSMVVLNGFAADAGVAADARIMAELDAIRQQHGPVHDELKAKGLKEKKIVKLFEEAGRKDLYLPYRFLCTFTHNQLNTLAGRHVGRGQILLGQPLPDETLKMILGLSIMIYAQALQLAPNFSDIKAVDVTQAHAAADARWSSLPI